jgi:hypothetical protein
MEEKSAAAYRPLFPGIIRGRGKLDLFNKLL